MEIKSYIKDIPQPLPPPIKQKRIELDVSFDEFAIIVASVGVCDQYRLKEFIKEHLYEHQKESMGDPSKRSYSVYLNLFEYARKADILKDYK
jgi:hypothetical protein